MPSEYTQTVCPRRLRDGPERAWYVTAPMSSKFLIMLGLAVGSTLGSFLPALWGADWFSMWSVLLGLIGGLAGIWAGYKLSRL